MATQMKPAEQTPESEVPRSRMQLTARERETVGIGKLPPAVQQQLELRKAMNMIAAEVAKLNWGKALDENTRRAVADWGRRFDVDVTTEIEVLGGNIYLKANYYLRRLAGLVQDGLVEYAITDHVEPDARLDELAKHQDAVIAQQARGEISRRLFERIKHQVPDKAAAAVVFRVKLKALTEEITGCKWAGNGTRKSDPVGDAFPVESAESRAARRCLRHLVTHVPQIATNLELAAGEAEQISARIAHAKGDVARVNASHGPPKDAFMSLPATGSGYGEEVDGPKPAEKPRFRPATESRDAYGETGDERAADDDSWPGDD